MAERISDALEGFEEIQQYRELSPSGNIMEGALIATEGRFIAGAAEVEAEIERRRAQPPEEGGWRDAEEIRAILEGYSPEQQREQFRRAREQVARDFARIPNGYHDMLLLGLGTGPIYDAAKDLVVSLHNPVVRESLLLPVADDWQDEARDFMAQLAGIGWGFIETITLDQDEHYETYLGYLAERWDMETEELADYMEAFSAQAQRSD